MSCKGAAGALPPRGAQHRPPQALRAGQGSLSRGGNPPPQEPGPKQRGTSRTPSSLHVLAPLGVWLVPPALGFHLHQGVRLAALRRGGYRKGTFLVLMCGGVVVSGLL